MISALPKADQKKAAHLIELADDASVTPVSILDGLSRDHNGALAVLVNKHFFETEALRREFLSALIMAIRTDNQLLDRLVHSQFIEGVHLDSNNGLLRILTSSRGRGRLSLSEDRREGSFRFNLKGNPDTTEILEALAEVHGGKVDQTSAKVEVVHTADVMPAVTSARLKKWLDFLSKPEEISDRDENVLFSNLFALIVLGLVGGAGEMVSGPYSSADWGYAEVSQFYLAAAVIINAFAPKAVLRFIGRQVLRVSGLPGSRKLRRFLRGLPGKIARREPAVFHITSSQDAQAWAQAVAKSEMSGFDRRMSDEPDFVQTYHPPGLGFPMQLVLEYQGLKPKLVLKTQFRSAEALRRAKKSGLLPRRR